MPLTDAEIHKNVRSMIKTGDLKGLNDFISAHPESLHMDTPFGSWLHVAAAFGKVEIVQTLIERGLEINAKGGIADGNALHRAASNGHLEVVEYLFGNGAIMDTSESKSNPLFGAIINEHMEVGKYLVESGIDWKVCYNTETMSNMDAIAFATERGASSFVEFLESIE